MQEPTIGMIMPWPLNTIPYGWHYCNGTILLVQEYMALFSILGNAYGGDGQTTFALPDLRSRVQIGATTPPFSENGYPIGRPGGGETVILNTNEIPLHSHKVKTGTHDQENTSCIPVSTAPATDQAAVSGTSVFAQSRTTAVDPSTGNTYNIYNYSSGAGVGSNVYSQEAVSCNVNAPAPSISIENAGESMAHYNVQPYLTMNFIIAVKGNYPLRPDQS